MSYILKIEDIETNDVAYIRLLSPIIYPAIDLRESNIPPPYHPYQIFLTKNKAEAKIFKDQNDATYKKRKVKPMLNEYQEISIMEA